MAQSLGAGSASAWSKGSTAAASAPMLLESPSPLRRTRGGFLLKVKELSSPAHASKQIRHDGSPLKISTPNAGTVPRTTIVEEGRDETPSGRRECTMVQDSRDRRREANEKPIEICAPIPFPTTKSQSVPIRMQKSRTFRTMRCVRTIDEHSVLLDEDFVALEEYIEGLELGDNSTYASDMEDALVDMVLLDIDEGELPHAMSALSSSQLFVYDDDYSIDSLEADLESTMSSESKDLIGPPCLAKGAEHEPSPSLSFTIAETVEDSIEKPLDHQIQVESTQTPRESSGNIEEPPQSQSLDELMSNTSISASNNPTSLTLLANLSVKERQKSFNTGTQNKASITLKSNSTISTVPSVASSKNINGDQDISRLASVSSMSSTVLDDAPVASETSSDESEESDDSSNSDIDKVRLMSSTITAGSSIAASDAELSTEWDNMLETISQKLFVPTPGKKLPTKQDQAQSQPNSNAQGNLESMCSNVVYYLRCCFDEAQEPRSVSFGSVDKEATEDNEQTHDTTQNDTEQTTENVKGDAEEPPKQLKGKLEVTTEGTQKKTTEGTQKETTERTKKNTTEGTQKETTEGTQNETTQKETTEAPGEDTNNDESSAEASNNQAQKLVQTEENVKRDNRYSQNSAEAKGNDETVDSLAPVGNASKFCCCETFEFNNLCRSNSRSGPTFLCKDNVDELLSCKAQGGMVDLSGPSLSSISVNSLSANPGRFGQTQPVTQICIPKQITSRNVIRSEDAPDRPPLAPPVKTGRWRRVLNIRRKIPPVGRTRSKSRGRSFGSGIKTM